MVNELAAFFRHSLGLPVDRKVTLAQELTLVRHFVAIEQVRFGPRLRFEAEVGEGAGECLLPPMLLQPLVENAVKHGIGQMVEPGTIRIQAARAGSLLRIQVENDVDPDCVPKTGMGIGLENVRQRLATSYGHEASARWAREETCFRVALTLPFDTIDETTEA
jgi:LytS/YehU family sensor histidine kinase